MEDLRKTILDAIKNGPKYRQGLQCDESLDNIGERRRFFHRWCESPIEMTFAMAFTDHCRVHTFAPDDVPDAFHERSVVLVPQLKVRRYRLDFAVLFQAEGQIEKWAIECDGKDWHTSDNQVKRDKLRDFSLRSDGWRVMRYKGWALHHFGGGVADRVHQEIDLVMSGTPPSDLPRVLDPEQYEEAGDPNTANWYRMTAPFEFGNGQGWESAA